MKARLLIAAIALAAPAASFADPHGIYPYGHRHPRVRYPAYRYYPPFGFYFPAPIVGFTFAPDSPRVYQATPYSETAESSLEATVQRALRKRGYYSGPLDGDLGPRSRAAIREYQAEHGLEVSGRVDDPLLQSLGL